MVLPEGCFHYSPRYHRLEPRTQSDLRPALAAAALGQAPVREAPAVLVLAAVPARTAAKYGSRAERYVALEAGHVAQNVCLQATALGLGALTVGAFEDERVAEVLALPSGTVPIYLLPVGRAR